MAPMDPWEPLIAFFHIFTAAVTNPLLALLVVMLVSAARSRWPMATGLPALAALDAAFVHVTESHPPPWPILAAGEALGVLAQGMVAVLMVTAARRWVGREER
ncbi:MAG TPA: hypothetical protein VEB64_15065 [Azospirillaceae bacterium]|nr:hypothetical protein [Azospirillaceae bacterium]